MNKTYSFILIIILLNANSSTTLTSPNTLNTLSLLNQDDQLVRQLSKQQPFIKLPTAINLDLSNLNANNLDLLGSLNTNLDTSPPLNSSKINVIDAKSMPALNTADLWRLLNSKLRIGSLFSRTNRANESPPCQCAQSTSDKPITARLIPIPVVERIHHVYDKPNSNKLMQPSQYKSILELKKPFDPKYSTYELKQPLDYHLKNVYMPNLYDMNRPNEHMIKNDLLDRARFLELQNQNDLINGRSISAVRTFNPPLNLNEDIYLQNNLPNFNANLGMNLGTNLLNRETNQVNGDQLDNLNNLNKQSFQDVIDEGTGRNSYDQHKDSTNFNPSKIVNEISQLVISELDSVQNSQRDFSKMKILKLLGDLDRFMIAQRWSKLDRQDTKLDRKFDKLNKRNDSRSSRWPVHSNDFLMDSDDLMTDNLIKDLDSKLDSRLNGKMSSKSSSKSSSKADNKKSFFKNKTNNEVDENVDDEYFTDYLPSESEQKETAAVYNDFRPIKNPEKFLKLFKDRKNQINDTKLIKKANLNKLDG